MRPPQSRSRLEEFDVMRGLAIIFIVFRHLQYFSFNFYDLNNFGIGLDLSSLSALLVYFGLGLFVYISGVLLQRNYPGLSGRGQVFSFIKKRFFTIFPLYYVALAIYLKEAAVTNIKVMNIIYILAHATGLQLILASHRFPPLYTLWFIGLITLYYWLFILIKRTEGNTARLFIVILGFPLILLVLKIKAGIGDTRLLLYYPVFLSGLFGEGYFARIRSGRKKKAVLAVLFIASLYLYVFHVYGSSRPLLALSIRGLEDFLLIGFITISFTWLVRLASLERARIQRYFKPLAFSSYCIYLFHKPVWWALLSVYSPQDPVTRLSYLGLIGITVTVLISHAAQKAYNGLTRRALGYESRR